MAREPIANHGGFNIFLARKDGHFYFDSKSGRTRRASMAAIKLAIDKRTEPRPAMVSVQGWSVPTLEKVVVAQWPKATGAILEGKDGERWSEDKVFELDEALAAEADANSQEFLDKHAKLYQALKDLETECRDRYARIRSKATPFQGLKPKGE